MEKAERSDIPDIDKKKWVFISHYFAYQTAFFLNRMLNLDFLHYGWFYRLHANNTGLILVVIIWFKLPFSFFAFKKI